MTSPADLRNLITDVPGIAVGQAQDTEVRTGVTVVLPAERAVAACAVAGGGPGTRETDALDPANLVDAVDAVVLSGGSVYGLAAADGVTAWLGARGRGYALVPGSPAPPSPVVPTAILYDLANGGDKAWGEDPPYRRLGYQAVAAAGEDVALGTVGAGTGAMAGSLKGGVGSASAIGGEAYTVGAIAAVNSHGSVVAPGGRTFWAAPFEQDGEFGGLGSAGLSGPSGEWGHAKSQAVPRQSTTIACVATDVTLTPAEARRVALMAQAGLARAIRPVFAPFDGDVVFVLSTGLRPLEGQAMLARLGSLAADVLARAIARGVFEATPWPATDVRCWRDLTDG